jgi:hypothetical protein
MKIKLNLALSYAALVIVMFTGSNPHVSPFTQDSTNQYSQTENWAQMDTSSNRDYDVFFVHPTTYFNTDDGMNASLSNEAVNKQTDIAIDRQASVFKGSCNIFAPRYRQMSMQCLYLDSSYQAFLDIAIADISDALDYYLKNLNNGRDIIIAGHSQGSNIILEYLLENHDSTLMDKVISVYAIGYTFTQENLDTIGINISTNDTMAPAFITWNTIGIGGHSPVLKDGAVCVNPLNWDTTQTTVDASQNIMSRIMYKDGDYMYLENFSSASINSSGGLIIPTPNIINLLDTNMGPEVYHAYDYDFFYGNIAKNVAKRCETWSRQKQH